MLDKARVVRLLPMSKVPEARERERAMVYMVSLLPALSALSALKA